ncbi:helix-turn-helix domain-containing protein [Enterococcus faecium]|uniref:helix-turn-helix domain-containing protein n=1 Tax=Enterococcus faecium TaxID=1352 RepID=UPI0010653D3B|nr:helix-turn-helix domain-containing protein [Enterococcus faecium]TEA56689.1 hypothetical protein CWC53_11215 [Enterococcus faecium]
MTYTHLTPNELVMIEAYFHQETPVAIVAKQLKRGRQTIYNVYNFLKCGGTALEYFEQYKENKRRCGRTEIIFPAEEKEYIEKRSTEGWTPDVINPPTPTQRGLKQKDSNGLLRKDGLPKEMEFNQVNQGFISSVASKRNHIPRKSLNYQTPLEVFLSYVNGKFCLA